MFFLAPINVWIQIVEIFAIYDSVTPVELNRLILLINLSAPKFLFVKEFQEKHDVCLQNGEHGFGEEDTDGAVVEVARPAT